MTISELLYALPKDVDVRISIMCGSTFTGTTGPMKSKRIIDRLATHNAADARVLGIYPLWHAREIYIECAPLW